MRRIIVGVIVGLGVLSCVRYRWQPRYQPDDDPTGGAVPTVTFGTLLECQQYLDTRFGRVPGNATLSCYTGCRSADRARPEAPGFDRLGALDCPREGRQLVGQLVN